ncbi:MAG: peptidoglycan DD-metalloendopeptidase family protein [Candidatus Eisenbacteria bacterium]|nr:peptidoglycan DD-metalloendopeptidase family protein [Candidatus Eisenbacteria bacterium]
MTRRPLLALLAALALMAPGAPRAQTPEDSAAAVRRREEEIRLESAKRRELEEVRQQAQQSREQARKLKGRETQALGMLKRTERELNLTRRRLRLLQQHRAKLDQQIDVTQTSLERTVVSLEQQKGRLARRLRNMYKAGASRDLEFLLSTRSFAQLLARWDFVVMVAEQDRLLLEDIQGKKEQVEADQQQLVSNRSEVEQNARETERQNRKLDTLRRQRAGTVQQIRTQRQTYEAAAAELEKAARDIQRLLARLEARRREEEQRARAQGRQPEPYTGDFARGRGQLDWPVRGDLVGRFGPEKHPRFGTVTLNNGVDIEAPAGTPVRAVAKGRVDYTSDDYGSFGQIVIVNHGDGYYTLYMHLSEILAQQGLEVQSGQVLGRVGDSGTSLKGTVLHFEVRKGGSALDPEDWLK